MKNMAAMPRHGKNLTKSSSPEPVGHNLGTYSMCMCKWVLPRVFKLWPGLTLTHFGRVKFGFISYCMGKSKNCVHFGNYCSLMSQSWLKHSTKWVLEVTYKWISKVKVIIWPWLKVTQISELKLVFLWNSWVIWNQGCESLWENGNENLYKWVGSHHAYTCIW